MQVTPESLNPINQAVSEVRQALVDLRRFVDQNDGQIRDHLGTTDLTVKDLENVVYGNNRQDTPGILKRVSNLERMVEAIEVSRREERATLKGIKIGLVITGATGAGTLVSVLSQLF